MQPIVDIKTLAMVGCVRTAGGRYVLNIRGAGGKLRRVKNIGFGTQPFEVIAQFAGTPFIAIKKYTATPRGVIPKLYLLNTATGLVDESTRDGVGAIAFNPMTKQFAVTDVAPRSIVDAANQQKPGDAGNKSVPQIVTSAANGTAIQTIVRPPRPRRRKNKVRELRKIMRRRGVAKNISTSKKRGVARGAVKRPALSAKMTVPYSLKPRQKIKYNVLPPNVIAARRKFMQMQLQRKTMNAIQMQY